MPPFTDPGPRPVVAAKRSTGLGGWLTAADPGPPEDTAVQAGRAPGADPEEDASGAPGGARGARTRGPDEHAEAPGSPIIIPTFQQIGGQPVDKVRAEQLVTGSGP